MRSKSILIMIIRIWFSIKKIILLFFISKMLYYIYIYLYIYNRERKRGKKNNNNKKLIIMQINIKLKEHASVLA